MESSTDPELKVKAIEIEVVKFKQDLPAYLHKQEILQEIGAVRENKFCLLVGQTGSGKSTQIPQYLLLNLLMKPKLHFKKIYCVLPRKVAARSLANRIIEEMGDLGKLKVGYQIGLYECSESVKN